jgi:hypothetical protein
VSIDAHNVHLGLVAGSGATSWIVTGQPRPPLASGPRSGSDHRALAQGSGKAPAPSQAGPTCSSSIPSVCRERYSPSERAEGFATRRGRQRCRTSRITESPRGVAFLLATFVGFSMMTSSAQADEPIPGPVPPPITFTAAPASGSGATSAPQAAAAAIVCKFQVQDPHNSTHVGGTVNVVATVSCVPAAESLSIRVTLYKVVCDPGCSQVPYGVTGSAKNVGKATIQANSAASCSSGDYFGVSYATIVAPPGFTPPSANVSGSGRTVAISC